MTQRPIIALTPGEPAGVGPDVALSFVQQPPACDVVLIADPVLLAARAVQLGLSFSAKTWPGHCVDKAAVYVVPIPAAQPITAGRLSAANSSYVIACLQRATQGCLTGEFDALVTGPVHKGIINDAGIAFSGHTEFLARAANVAQVVMMLAAPGLRVALTTTHLPLAQVSQAITRAHLTAVLRILHSNLKEKFAIADPQILVCGLNPHAGEGGHLGREEIDVIEPVLQALRDEGFRLRGPVPADTAFLAANLVGMDVVLAMYHDQGLPVLKRHDFAHAINVTLGLPFVRTSVDHGTALELAGSGRADVSSLRAAVDAALNMLRPNDAH